VSKCVGCGAELPDAEERRPCPACGDVRRHFDIGVAESVGLADDAHIRIEYGPDRPWEQKWGDVTRLFAEIERVYATRAGSTDDVREAVETYFKATRELADWVKHKTGKDALALVNTDPALKICDGFAQTLKHHTRTKVGSISARIFNIDTAPPGVRVEIAWRVDSGPETTVDALDLARDCMAAWRRWFSQEGLTPPA
jgi:hypothetical protein